MSKEDELKEKPEPDPKHAGYQTFPFPSDYYYRGVALVATLVRCDNIWLRTSPLEDGGFRVHITSDKPDGHRVAYHNRHELIKGRDWQFRMLAWDDMLYPQHEDQFQKKMSPAIWTMIQEMARQRLEDDLKFVHPDVKAHWEMLVVADGPPWGWELEE